MMEAYSTRVTPTGSVGTRAALAALDPYSARPRVADLERSLGVARLVRLDANESPDGPFPAARAALAEAVESVNRYPESDTALIEALSARLGIPAGMIALGNGADAIIGYISGALLQAGEEVLTAWPSFPTYIHDARKLGASVVLAPLAADGSVDLGELASRVGARTRIVWICSPNNPTGGSVDPGALDEFLDAVPESTLVVIDEAYHEYGEGEGHADAIRDHLATRPNVGALRTFSKIYGLAALRVGYFAGPPAVADALGRIRHYYDVTEPGLLAAIASLQEDDELVRRRTYNSRARSELRASLQQLGISCLPSDANFLALDVGDADEVSERLLERGVMTRSLAPLGLPGRLRVAIGSPGDLAALVEQLPASLGR